MIPVVPVIVVVSAATSISSRVALVADAIVSAAVDCSCAEWVWVALHVLACAGFRDATTDPVVGEMVKLPSEFVTLLTAPDPVPQAAPVFDRAPEELICKQ